MRRILSALLSLSVVAALAGCQWRPPAATVNGEEITAADLEADVEVMRDNPELAAAFQLSVGAEGEPVPSQVTAQLLTIRIGEIVLSDAYERSADKLSAEDEQAQRDNINAQLLSAVGSQEAIDKIPESFRTRLLDRFVHSSGLLADVPDENFQAAVTALFGAYDVDIDPRYGTWDTTTFEVITNAPPGVSGAPVGLPVQP